MEYPIETQPSGHVAAGGDFAAARSYHARLLALNLAFESARQPRLLRDTATWSRQMWRLMGRALDRGQQLDASAPTAEPQSKRIPADRALRATLLRAAKTEHSLWVTHLAACVEAGEPEGEVVDPHGPCALQRWLAIAPLSVSDRTGLQDSIAEVDRELHDIMGALLNLRGGRDGADLGRCLQALALCHRELAALIDKALEEP